MQTNDYYWIEIVNWMYIIVNELVLVRNTWNYTTVCKLFGFDRNTWYHVTMCKEMIIDQKQCNGTSKI